VERLTRSWILWIMLALGVAGMVHWMLYERRVGHASGMLAESPPTMAIGSDAPPWIDVHGFRYRPLGRISGRVVVVSRKKYSLGEFASFAPTDLAIVWGPLSDPDNYSQFNFDQRGSPLSARFVVPELKSGTDYSRQPIGEVRAFLLANLTHVHTIPADPAIASKLAGIRPGQVIRFSGLLVDVMSPANVRYTSSLALHDYNCEIAWIDELELGA